MITIKLADYSHVKHQRDIPTLLNAYAKDPMGGSQALSDTIKHDLVSALAKHGKAFSILAYDGDDAIGLANCFEGFSTFACKPLINIHDLFVLKTYRGNDISQMLLDKIEEVAVGKGCCKITLEVLSNNEVAKASYRKFGFSNYELTPEAGAALFWQKELLE